MQAANCIRFYLDHFCCEVNRQKLISLDNKLKDHSGELYCPFFYSPLFYTIKALNGKLTVFLGDFSQPV